MTSNIIITPEGDEAHCRKCDSVLTEDDWSEDAWIEWLQQWCTPCVTSLVVTVSCAGCGEEMTGVPGMDWGVWTSWDGTHEDHVCEPCHQQAEAQRSQDESARAARL